MRGCQIFCKRTIRLILIALIIAANCYAQSTPFLSFEEIRSFINEISGDRSYEHIRWLTHWHRLPGAKGYFEAADYILEAAKEVGLEDVRFVEQPLLESFPTVTTAELWMVEPVELKLADIGDHATYLTDGSSDADVTAELVWIGDASAETLEDIDVTGKIVLTNAIPFVAVQTAVWERGALGIVSCGIRGTKKSYDYPDQIQWTFIPPEPPEGKPHTFAFNLPFRKADNLRRILETDDYQDYFATGMRTRGGRVILRALVKTEPREGSAKTGFVEGWIRGTKYHDQQIVLTAHIQEEQGSANDDSSGCGNMLELARTLNKLIEQGKIERPLRDIRFWWTDEIYSEYRYFRDHPDEPKKMIANINQDMVGARQSMGSRVQHLVYAPFSRTSYLDTVLESVATYVIRTNNAFISSGRARGYPSPHLRPIYSTRGSREGYNAALIPYISYSDHICFLGGPIGVPAILMIDWEDDYIHSSDDDLFNVDQTQLARNTFIVGAISYILASAEAEDASLLASETFLIGNKRLTRDLAAATRILRDSLNSANSVWKDAVNLLEQGIEREVRALESTRLFAGNDIGAKNVIDRLIARVRAKKQEMTADLESTYLSLYRREPGEIELSAEEVSTCEKIPANTASLDTYFDSRDSVTFQGNLHTHMREEVFNFVDGKRSYYDIYKAVRAEALSVGEWYYGTVSLEDVCTLLDAAVEAGALELQK